MNKISHSTMLLLEESLKSGNLLIKPNSREYKELLSAIECCIDRTCSSMEYFIENGKQKWQNSL